MHSSTTSHPNYLINPHLHPHFFELETGVLLLDESGRESHRQAPELVMPLGQLLLDQTIEIDRDQYPKIDVKNWNYAKYLLCGQWLHKLVTPPDQEWSNISEKVIERGYHLGLGPYPRRITRHARFRNLFAFYAEASIAVQESRGNYDAWDHGMFAEYVLNVYLSKPEHLSLSEAIDAAADSHNGRPTAKIIRHHAGSLRSLLTESGHNDIKEWTIPDDYFDWGVAFKLANGGKRPTRYDLDYLSHEHRGPSTRTIVNHFDKLSTYQQEIEGRYQEKIRQMREVLRSRMIKIASEDTRVWKSLAETFPEQSAATWQSMRITAQYLLLNSYRTDMSVQEKIRIASKVHNENFNALALRACGVEDISALKQRAGQFNLAADIWPRHNPEHLEVPKVKK